MTRRRFLRITAVAAGLGVACAAGGQAAWRAQQRQSQTRLLMGTIATLTIVAPDGEAARAAIDAAFQRMSALEAILSRFQPESQLARLNREGRLRSPAPELVALLLQAQEIHRLSAGAFDVTVKPVLDLYQHYQAAGRGVPPDNEIVAARDLVDATRLRVSDDEVALETPGMAVTLDGIAKGYIVGAGARLLAERGYGDVLVEAGGDLQALGGKQGGSSWRVGVQAPRAQQGSVLATFGLHDGAAATSGDYMQPFTTDRRLHHIIDPRTGYSPQEPASVTTLAPDAALADALATALMVMGAAQAQRLLDALPLCSALFVGKDGTVTRSPGFPA